MIFDHRAELPTATLLPRDSSARLSLDTRNWFGARWRWLRPRTVPVLVAFAGMLAVLGSAHYLRNLAHEAPERVTLKPLELHVSTNEVTTTATQGSLVVSNGPAAATIVLVEPGKTIRIAPGVYQIKLEPAAAK